MQFFYILFLYLNDLFFLIDFPFSFPPLPSWEPGALFFLAQLCFWGLQSPFATLSRSTTAHSVLSCRAASSHTLQQGEVRVFSQKEQGFGLQDTPLSLHVCPFAILGVKASRIQNLLSGSVTSTFNSCVILCLRTLS